jgi:hypothetical protein
MAVRVKALFISSIGLGSKSGVTGEKEEGIIHYSPLGSMRITYRVSSTGGQLRDLFNMRITYRGLFNERTTTGISLTYRDATTCNKATRSLQGSDYRSACQNYKYICNYSKDSTALYSCQGEKTRHGRHFWFV